MRWVILWLLALALPVRAEIPARPGGSYVVDFANVVEREAQSRLNRSLGELYARGHREIVIVTIPSMKRYSKASSIERFSKEWYERWRLASQDVLLIVSVGDRKARIQLGSHWPGRWDGHCQRVMNETLIPHFKKGDFGEGVLAGGAKLTEMVEIGPGGKPPGYTWKQQLYESTNHLFSLSTLPRGTAMLLCALGLAVMIGGFFISPRITDRMLCLGVGALIIVFTLATTICMILFWIVVIVILSPNRRYGYGWGGGYSSGGGFSLGGGGFGGGGGGGGGATGSW